MFLGFRGPWPLPLPCCCGSVCHGNHLPCRSSQVLCTVTVCEQFDDLEHTRFALYGDSFTWDVSRTVRGESTEGSSWPSCLHMPPSLPQAASLLPWGQQLVIAQVTQRLQGKMYLPLLESSVVGNTSPSSSLPEGRKYFDLPFFFHLCT